MRRSPTLGLYLALSGWRRDKAARAEAPPRPKGALLWLHAPDNLDLPAVVDLLRRLVDERPGTHVLLSAPDPGTDTPALPRRVQLVPLPPGDRAGLAAFIAHWQPDAFAQVGGPPDPQVLMAVTDLGLRPILVNLAPAGRAFSLVPGLSRGALGTAARILVSDPISARRMRRLLGPAAPIETIGPLEPAPPALPHTEAEREAVAGSLGGRPVWLAAALPSDEVEAVIAAHRAALRLAHRLLLIVVPHDLSAAPALVARMTETEGWNVALRSNEEGIEEDCHVYIADTEGELGLWFRIAPITYMGGTLSDAGSLRPPTEPAALGSAIIHGPRPGQHEKAYANLRAARATRELRNPADLGEAVGDLLAPDRAAQLAHNAWASTTSGAEVADRVLRLIVEALRETRGPA